MVEYFCPSTIYVYFFTESYFQIFRDCSKKIPLIVLFTRSIFVYIFAPVVMLAYTWMDYALFRLYILQAVEAERL